MIKNSSNNKESAVEAPGSYSVERLYEREKSKLTMENIQVEITLHLRYRSI